MSSVTVSSDTFVDAGEQLAARNQFAFDFEQSTSAPGASLYIDGAVTDSWDTQNPADEQYWNDYYGVWVGAYPTQQLGVMHIGQTGSLSVTNSVDHGLTSAFFSGEWGPDVVNDGHLSVTAAGAAMGLYTTTHSVITNAGTFSVEAGHAAYGVDATNGATFTNSGVISVDGHGVDQPNLTYSILPAQPTAVRLNGDSAFHNSGSISIDDHDASHDSIGVQVFGYDPMAFDNAGRISGDVALKYVYANVPGHAQVITNEGVMDGRVELVDSQWNAGFQLVNSGQITGSVSFSLGDDTYDGSEGQVGGLVSGGDGNDSLTGGAQFDYLQGNAGNDTEHGGAGDDWVVGGKDNDVLFGDAGGDVVYGNLGNDTLDGGDGADQVRGGQGDDVIQGGAGDDWLSGDRGADTITGGAGADIFHSFSGAGLDVVTDFNAAEGDRVMLDPGTTYTLTQSGADTVVDMGNGDQLVLQHTTLASLPAGWIFEG